MNIGTEQDPIEVPLPVHPDEQVPAELPAEPDLEPAPAEPVPAGEMLFEGHQPRECGEHRTLGQRAWCSECSEYCYLDQDAACKGCRIPMLERRLQAGTPS